MERKTEKAVQQLLDHLDGYRDPVRLLLLAASRLWLRQWGESGFLTRAHHVWRELVQAEEDAERDEP